jgi:outer membrane biosynthesis protein TonB
MNKAKGRSSGILRLLSAVVLAGAVWAPVLAYPQDAQPADKPGDQNAQPAQPSATQERPKPSAPQEPLKQEPSKEKEEVKITPRQAEELFHSVDEILDFDSKQTGLPIKRDVKRKLTSRDEVVSFLT